MSVEIKAPSYWLIGIPGAAASRDATSRRWLAGVIPLPSC